jgi:ribosomal protein L32
MKIVFVGLSNKMGKEPLDQSTATGKIIARIADRLNAEYYKINLVQFVPVDENGKLRNPTKREIIAGSLNVRKFVDDVKPDRVVLLGKTVFENLQFDNGFKMYHPGYVVRNGITINYIDETVKKLTKTKPKMEIFHNSIDQQYTMPMCPTCGEPTYSKKICPFCGQEIDWDN